MHTRPPDAPLKTRNRHSGVLKALAPQDHGRVWAARKFLETQESVVNASKGRVVAPGVRNDGALTGDAVWLFSAWRSGVLKDLGPGHSDGVRAARYVRGKWVGVVKHSNG